MNRGFWVFSILVACVLGVCSGVGEAEAQFTDCSAITGMPQSECQALVDLYDSTNGANWTTKTGWKQTSTPCSWYQVVCDGGHVSQLRLHGNNLVGTIPASFGDLTSLAALYLSGNQLSGNIPAEIGNLSKLVHLDLFSNQLSGSIPAEIGNLTKLGYLRLSYNQLRGGIPMSVGNLVNLTYLEIGPNLFGSIPAEIGNLTKLTTLYLGGNQFSGSIPDSIGNLTKLTDLRLHLNQLSGSIPASIGNLTNLQVLQLYNNQLSGSIPDSIGNLANLTSLDLHLNQLSGSIPDSIGNLTKLTGLDLTYNQLSGSIPDSIGSLTKLTALFLYYNQLSGSIPDSIGNLTKLTDLRLYLYANQLSGSIPESIGNLTKLTTLSLHNNQLNGSIPKELGSLTSLTTLYLNTNQLSGSIPAEIGNLSSLTDLRLYINRLSGDIPTEIGNLTDLSILYLYNNQLSGLLPESISGLTKLLDLQIQRNELTGEIPSSILNMNGLWNFEYYANHFLVSVKGRIIDSAAVGIEGVNINVTGPSPTSAITAADGTFTVKIPDQSSYTLTPIKAGYEFLPVAMSGNLETEIIGGLEVTGQDFTGYYDTDGDGLNEIEEAEHGTDPANPDSDGDGVSDSEEIAKGTNPLDRGSAEITRPATLCSEWNGYLGMYNALEHVNLATNGRKYTTTLYSLAGEAEAPVNFSIAGGGEYDLLVHDLNGFENDRYGKVCTTVTNGQPGDLDGRMVFYKPDTATGGYQFAFALPLGNGLTGSQYVPYNTYQPSLDPTDAGHLAANWIQLTNLGATKQTGELVFYNQAGAEIARQEVTLRAGARFDYSAHDIAGVKQVGLVEWIPTATTARFQLRNVRYYYRADGVNVPLGDDFDSAFQLEGIVGSGQLLTVPLDTENSSSVLELANTLNEEVNAEVTIYAATGGEALHHQTYKLKPHGTYHLIADMILNGGQGIATVQGNKPRSVIATAMQYGRTETQGIQTVYGIQASEALGTVMRGSYNTFLKQDCRLLMVNPTATETIATVSMKRYDGTLVEYGRGLPVSAHGLTDYDLCSQDQENVYGVVTVQPDTPNTIFATVLRIGESEQYRFPTPVRD